MNETEATIKRLRAMFPNASRAFLAANCAMFGARPQLQEQQADRARKKRPALNAHHEAGSAEVDGVSDSEFHITVTLSISDQRDRDNDGAYTTLQDCLIAAVGRLAQMDSLTLRKHAARLKRK
jgi:hypothetical protein